MADQVLSEMYSLVTSSVRMYSTDRVFFQKSSPAGGEWIRVERIKFWNPTASSPVPVDSPRSRDEIRLKFFLIYR